MASNFRISNHKNKATFHMKLQGDFDDSSARALLNAIKKIKNRAQNIFIHTGSLKSIHPFGRNIFQKNLVGLKLQPERIIFTGERAGDVSPDKRMCL